MRHDLNQGSFVIACDTVGPSAEARRKSAPDR